jgi:ABC-type uncharacterized transport system permease subunit
MLKAKKRFFISLSNMAAMLLAFLPTWVKDVAMFNPISYAVNAI